MKWRLLLVMALFVVVVTGFVLWTFPTSHNSKRSNLTVKVLPPNRWGVGYYCEESPTNPAAGYVYGVILVKRTYNFRP